MKSGSSPLSPQQVLEKNFQADFQRYAPQTFLELQQKTAGNIEQTFAYQLYLGTYISCRDSGICPRTKISFVEKIFGDIENKTLSSNMSRITDQEYQTRDQVQNDLPGEAGFAISHPSSPARENELLHLQNDLPGEAGFAISHPSSPARDSDLSFLLDSPPPSTLSSPRTQPVASKFQEQGS